MEYQCVTAPADRLIVNNIGIVDSLCTNCKSVDCTNPIQEQVVSVIGLPKRMRMWTSSNVVRQVVSCDGFVNDVPL